jgi:N-methylhydantoinase B
VPDVEVHEASDPVLFLWRRISPNSGGPGHRRGGQGLDEAYVLGGRHSFAGFTTVECSEYPPPGFGGGLPPSAGLQYPIRATSYGNAAVDARRLPRDEDGLGGTRELIGTKVGHFVLNPGDVLRAIGGGGAGLGDPLLRSAELVVSDVRDGYITREHATAAYGVITGMDGELDGEATRRRREELRAARIGHSPERDAVAPDLPGLSVTVSDGNHEREWCCGYCGGAIAPLAQDWRQAVVRHEAPLAELFGGLGMRLRERTVPPQIQVVSFYCALCAGCLATDVTTDRAEPVLPVLAATVGVA